MFETPEARILLMLRDIHDDLREMRLEVDARFGRVETGLADAREEIRVLAGRPGPG